VAGARLARGLAVAGALLALAAGCAERRVLPVLDPQAVRALVDSYVRGNALRMQAVQSVVMSWRHRPFTALGWFRYDREQGTFTLVGLNPAGASLFSLSEAGGQAAGAFAALPGGDPAAWTRAMAQDVRRIYFDGVPRLDDDVRASGSGVVLTRRTADGIELRLNLAADPLRSEAEWLAGGRRVGTTIYEDYETRGALRVPMRIVHRNRVYGYELVIRTKEIQALEGAVTAGEIGVRPGP
jgi:hypothetical protein